MNAIQNASLNAMDHLFNNFAFMVRERTMGDIDSQKTSSEQGVQDKLKKRHILGALDYLETSDRSGMSEKLCEEFSREIVITLKSELQKHGIILIQR